jgi:hypothetical protein
MQFWPFQRPEKYLKILKNPLDLLLIICSNANISLGAEDELTEEERWSRCSLTVGFFLFMQV